MADYTAIIDAIDAAILAMMSAGGAQTVTIEGRNVVFYDLEKLQKTRDYYVQLQATQNSKLPFQRYLIQPESGFN